MHDPSSVGDKTAHLLSHTFIEATEDRVHGIIKGYIEDNPRKIQELAGPWLKWKKTMVSDNVNFIIERGSKFDELALMIFSIATKCHIGVIHSDNSMWTTNESGDMEECDVLFLNKGGKPKSSSKKGDDEGGKEGVRVTRVMRAMQKKLDEEEERKKATKTDKKDKKKKKKKDRKVKKDEEEIGEKEGKEDEPVEKKQKLEEDIKDVDVKP